MARTASGRDRPLNPASSPSPENPAKPRARAATLALAVGKGWTRVIRPHGVGWLRTSLPPQPSAIRWCSYHGSEVTTWSRCPARASSSPMADMTTPVGATSGS